MLVTHNLGGYTQKMELKDQLAKSLAELRKGKERKFNQTVDLIVNLQKFDVKRSSVNLVIALPHQIKEKKICAFLESKNKNVDTITKDEFKKYNDKKALKNLVNKYDFFIAEGTVMPKVATTFGRVLGPAGKMPSPQLGIMMDVNDKALEELKIRINNSIKIKVQEASIKLAVGKQSMKDEDILENVETIYNSILKELPRGKENVKNVELKFTMTKPQKIQVR